ncbi:MAG: ribose-phosphate pyrophosphokinase [Chloroflexi bacterium]|nr:ribose-phosphate pyrophosphokinase [Chloroflexota bacterium]MBU1750261.1 ribose-phosphate pyrophosphokinase [Chloroflexota bacterium]MBU1880277.1 ribose-phosphate pyrophosphokinase [Chloroflexota bacterium]
MSEPGELTVLSGRANPALAQAICDHLGVAPMGADVFEFNNSNTFVRLHHSVRSHDVYIVQPTCAPANQNVMELLIMIDAARRASAGRVTAVVPYYGYGRSDKKDQPRVPVTARLVADLITVAGADRLLTLDFHAEQLQGFFNIPADELSALPILRHHFELKMATGELDPHNLVAVAADVGATKRARDFGEHLGVPLVVIEKRRLYDEEGTKVRFFNVIGDVQGRTALIVDDEVDTGTSLIMAVEALRREGAARIMACCTHPVFSGSAIERIRAADDLEEIVVTDTIPLPANAPDKIKVVTVAPFLADVIGAIHEGTSVGRVFDRYAGAHTEPDSGGNP